jgi:hypothetical protein
MQFSALRHFVVIYNCPERAATAREFPDHTSAAVAYEQLDPDSFGFLYDVTVVSAESILTLEKLHGCPVTLGRTAG